MFVLNVVFWNGVICFSFQIIKDKKEKVDKLKKKKKKERGKSEKSSPKKSPKETSQVEEKKPGVLLITKTEKKKPKKKSKDKDESHQVVSENLNHSFLSNLYTLQNCG